MSSFAEIRFETGYIVYQTEGGPLFSTDVVTLNSGYEQRNQVWSMGRGQWDFGDRRLPYGELDEIKKFFRARKGRAQGFRFKDWADYTVSAAEGVFCSPGTSVFIGTGNGTPSLQLAKQYASGSDFDYRWIRKPVSGTVGISRNGTPVASGAGAGQWALDTTSGIVMFVADASSAVSAVTVGATTQVTLASNLGLVAGQLLYLSGFTAADGVYLNNIAHVINSISGTGPYVFTLATNTTGRTIPPTGGSGYKYPQFSDVLAWSGQFDIPVRFDTDQLKSRFEAADVSAPGVLGTTYHYLHALPLVEIRV